MSETETKKAPRRKYTIPSTVRLKLEARADALAAKLAAESDLTGAEAGDLVATVVGDALEMASQLVGAPDKVGDLLKAMGTKLTKALGGALKPDAANLIKKAHKAMEAGDWPKAKRLMERAEKAQARQAGKGEG